MLLDWAALSRLDRCLECITLKLLLLLASWRPAHIHRPEALMAKAIR